MRIVLSSAPDHVEMFREAAVRGIACLGHEVFQSDGLSPLRPDTTRQMCIAEARTADAMVLLLGGDYGFVQQNGLSATHEEYREARERCPVFVFLGDTATLDPHQLHLVNEIEAWDRERPIIRFRGVEDLRDTITCALHRWQLARTAGTVDLYELRSRAGRLIPSKGGLAQAGISIITVGGPWQQLVRPMTLDDPRFRRELQRDAMYGEHAVLDPDIATSTSVQDNVLSFEQTHASLVVTPDGSVRITYSWRQQASRPAVVTHEYVHERVLNALGFSAAYLERIDQQQRLSDILPIIVGAGIENWIWRTDHDQLGHRSMAIDLDPYVLRLELDPPAFTRSAFGKATNRLAEDFTVLLRERARVPDLAAVAGM